MAEYNDIAVISLMAKCDNNSIKKAAEGFEKEATKSFKNAMENVSKETMDGFTSALNQLSGKFKNVNFTKFFTQLTKEFANAENGTTQMVDAMNIFIGQVNSLEKISKKMQVPVKALEKLDSSQLENIIVSYEKFIKASENLNNFRNSKSVKQDDIINKTEIRTLQDLEKEYVNAKKSKEAFYKVIKDTTKANNKSGVNINNPYIDENIKKYSMLISLYQKMGSELKGENAPKLGTEELVKYRKEMKLVLDEIIKMENEAKALGLNTTRKLIAEKGYKDFDTSMLSNTSNISEREINFAANSVVQSMLNGYQIAVKDAEVNLKEIFLNSFKNIKEETTALEDRFLGEFQTAQKKREATVKGRSNFANTGYSGVKTGNTNIEEDNLPQGIINNNVAQKYNVSLEEALNKAKELSNLLNGKYINDANIDQLKDLVGYMQRYVSLGGELKRSTFGIDAYNNFQGTNLDLLQKYKDALEEIKVSVINLNNIGDVSSSIATNNDEAKSQARTEAYSEEANAIEKLKQAKKELDDSQNKISELEETLMKQTELYESLNTQVTQLREKIKELESSDNNINIEDFNKQTEELETYKEKLTIARQNIEDLEDTISALYGRLDSYEENDVVPAKSYEAASTLIDTYSKKIEKLENQLKESQEQIAKFQSQFEEMQSDIKDKDDTSTSEQTNIQTKLGELANKIDTKFNEIANNFGDDLSIAISDFKEELNKVSLIEIDFSNIREALLSIVEQFRTSLSSIGIFDGNLDNVYQMLKGWNTGSKAMNNASIEDAERAAFVNLNTGVISSSYSFDRKGAASLKLYDALEKISVGLTKQINEVYDTWVHSHPLKDIQKVNGKEFKVIGSDTGFSLGDIQVQVEDFVKKGINKMLVTNNFKYTQLDLTDISEEIQKKLFNEYKKELLNSKAFSLDNNQIVFNASSAIKNGVYNADIKSEILNGALLKAMNTVGIDSSRLISNHDISELQINMEKLHRNGSETVNDTEQLYTILKQIGGTLDNFSGMTFGISEDSLNGVTSKLEEIVALMKEINGLSRDVEIENPITQVKENEILYGSDSEKIKNDKAEIIANEKIYGKTLQEVSALLDLENKEIEKGNLLFKERNIYFDKDGKAINASIGTHKGVDHPLDFSNENLVKSILHTHPLDKLNSFMYSHNDIEHFIDDALCGGAEDFFLKVKDRILHLDLSNLDDLAKKDLQNVYSHLQEASANWLFDVPNTDSKFIKSNEDKIAELVDKCLLKYISDANGVLETLAIDKNGNISKIEFELENTESTICDRILNFSRLILELYEKAGLLNFDPTDDIKADEKRWGELSNQYLNSIYKSVKDNNYGEWNTSSIQKLSSPTQTFDDMKQQDLVMLENYKNTLIEIDKLKVEPETEEIKHKIEELNKLADYFISKMSMLSENGHEISPSMMKSMFGWNARYTENDYPRDKLNEMYNIASEKNGLSVNLSNSFLGIEEEIARIESKSEDLRKSLTKAMQSSSNYVKGIKNAFEDMAEYQGELKDTSNTDEDLKLYQKDLDNILTKFPELIRFKDRFDDFGNAVQFTKTDEFNNFLATLPQAHTYLESIGYDFEKINNQDAIENKTQAFKEKGNIVDSVVDEEKVSLAKLEEGIDLVTSAVDKKTQAFKEEEQTVVGVVQRELTQLEILDSQILSIVEDLKQLSSIPLNVKLNTSDSQLDEDVVNMISSLKEKINGIDSNDLVQLGSTLEGLKISKSNVENLQRFANVILTLKSNLNNLSTSGLDFLKTIENITNKTDRLKQLSDILKSTSKQINNVNMTINDISSDNSKQNIPDKSDVATVTSNPKVQDKKANIIDVKKYVDNITKEQKALINLLDQEENTDSLNRFFIEQADSIDDVLPRYEKLKKELELLGWTISDLIQGQYGFEAYFSPLDKNASKNVSDIKNEVEKRRKIIDEFKRQIVGLPSSLNNALNNSNGNGFNLFIDNLNDVKNKWQEIKNLSQSGLIDDLELDSLLEYMDSFKNIDNLKTISLDKIKNLDKKSPNFLEQYQIAEKYLNDLLPVFNKINSDMPFTNDDVNKIKDFTKQMNKLFVDINKGESKLADSISINKLLGKIYDNLNKNSSMSKELRQQFEALATEIKGLGNNIPADKFKELNNEFFKLTAQMKEAGETGKSMWDKITSRAKGMSASFLAQYLSLYDGVRYARELFGVIKDLDTQLVDVKKTFKGNNSELEEMFKNSSSLAKQLGVTTSEILQQEAAWSRLGFSTKEEAETMAELSSQFASISPGVSTEQAQEGLVSAMKGFGYEVDEVERKIMDNVNKIGNTMATSNGDIINMLERSSAAMKAANNTIEETIALEAAAVEVTQNAESTGTAFRTISMRLRGYDEETEELSEDLVNIKGDIADLTKTAKNPVGVSIFKEGDPNTYKSTYEILRDISEIWDDLTDKQQAGLLEKLGGKRGGQVISSVLNDFSRVEDALETMKNADGSADEEMKIIKESIDYKLNALKETWIGTWQEIIGRDDVGNLIDMLTAFSEVISEIIKHIGFLNTAIIAGFSIYKLKNVLDGKESKKDILSDIRDTLKNNNVETDDNITDKTDDNTTATANNSQQIQDNTADRMANVAAIDAQNAALQNQNDILNDNSNDNSNNNGNHHDNNVIPEFDDSGSDSGSDVDMPVNVNPDIKNKDEAKDAIKDAASTIVNDALNDAQNDDSNSEEYEIDFGIEDDDYKNRLQAMLDASSEGLEVDLSNVQVDTPEVEADDIVDEDALQENLEKIFNSDEVEDDVDNINNSIAKENAALENLQQTQTSGIATTESSTTATQANSEANIVNAESNMEDAAAEDADTTAKQRNIGTTGTDDVATQANTGGNIANASSNIEAAAAEDADTAAKQRNIGATERDTAVTGANTAANKKGVAGFLSKNAGKIGAISTVVGMGANMISNNMEESTAKDVLSGVGNTLSFAGMGMSIAGPWGALAGAVIGAGTSMYSVLKKPKVAVEELEESLTSAASEINKVRSEYESSKADIKSLGKEYAELSQGISGKGKNNNLTSEEYERLVEISKELMETFPYLPHYYDENGQAIVNLSGSISQINEEFDKLIQKQNELALSDFDAKLPDLLKNADKTSDEYEKQIENTKKVIQGYKDAAASLKKQMQDDSDESGYIDYQYEISVDGATLEQMEKARERYAEMFRKVFGRDDFLSEAYKNGNAAGFTIDFYDMDPEQIAEMKAELRKNSDIIYSAFDSEIEDLQKELDDLYKNKKSTWSSVSSAIVDGLLLQMDSMVMDDDLQESVSQIIENLDYESITQEIANNLYCGDITLVTREDIMNAVKEQVINPLKDENLKKAVQEAFDALTNIQVKFNEGALSYNEYLKMLEEYIQKLRDAGVGEPIIQSVMIQFGYENAQEGSRKLASINARVASEVTGVSQASLDGSGSYQATDEEAQRYYDTVDKLKEAEDRLNISSEEEIGLLTKAIAGFRGKTFTTEQLITSYKKLKKASDDAKNSMEKTSSTQLVSDLNDVETELDKIGSAMADFKENGVFNVNNLDGVADYFLGIEEVSRRFDMSAINDAMKVLGSGTATAEEYQAAINTLADGMVRQSGILEKVSEDTRELSIMQLKAMGITNAEILVDEQLKIQKGELITEEQLLAAQEEANAIYEEEYINMTYDEIAADIALRGENELVRQELALLLIKKMDLNKNPINTVADIDALYALAEQAGIDIAMLNELQKAKEMAAKAESYEKSASADNVPSSVAAMYRKKAAEEREKVNDIAKGVQKTAATFVPEKADYTPTKAEYNGGSKVANAGKGKSGSGKDSDADKTKEELDETFDFFERRIEVLQQKFDILGKHIENALGATAKNKLVGAQMDLLKEEVNNYSDAMYMYEAKANELLGKLPADIQQKIKEGAVDLTQFVGDGNKEVLDAIKEYQQWANKVDDCNQKLVELKKTLRELALQKFTNIAEQFDDMFNISKGSSDSIQKQIDLFKEAGLVVGEGFYEARKTESQKQLSMLQAEKAALTEELNKNLDFGTPGSGVVDVGSEEWQQMIERLREVDDAILDAEKDIEGFDNAILDLHWENLTRIEEKFSNIASEIDDINSLMGEVTVSEDDGTWTSEGITQLGLQSEKLEAAQYAVRMYDEEITRLNNDYLAGRYSATEYAEKLEELKKKQRDEAKNVEDARSAIVDLAKARVEIMCEAIDREIDAMSELIEKKKDALDAEKD